MCLLCQSVRPLSKSLSRRTRRAIVLYAPWVFYSHAPTNTKTNYKVVRLVGILPTTRTRGIVFHTRVSIGRLTLRRHRACRHGVGKWHSPYTYWAMPFLVRVRIFTFRTYRETARSVQGQDGRRKPWLARESLCGYRSLRSKLNLDPCKQILRSRRPRCMASCMDCRTAHAVMVWRSIPHSPTASAMRAVDHAMHWWYAVSDPVLRGL